MEEVMILFLRWNCKKDCSISFDPNQQEGKYLWHFWSNLNSAVIALLTQTLHKTFPHQPELEIGIVRKSQSSKLVLFVKWSNHSFRGSNRGPKGEQTPFRKVWTFSFYCPSPLSAIRHHYMFCFCNGFSGKCQCYKNVFNVSLVFRNSPNKTHFSKSTLTNTSFPS